MPTSLVVHYDEIAIKGGRRRSFVRRLIRNIRQASPVLREAPLRRLYDRILIGPLDEADLREAEESLARVPGVSWFSQVRQLPATVESLDSIAEEFSVEPPRRAFRVQARRSKKDFPLTSMQINQQVGGMIQQRTGWPVDLDNPELTVYIDVTQNGILVYHAKQRGLGGLPVGSTGTLVSLLSGGIDSPVAAFKMMCRGCRVVFVHFHNSGPEAGKVRGKIVRLAEHFARFQPASRLYLVPFAKVQADLIAAVPPRLRMLAYRRAMLRLATPILEEEQAGGFLVGDSLGQVASQTLENLQATYPATDYPVFAPLIGDSKRATIDLAREIGTYEISILPYEDCCQLLIAKSPETKGTLAELAACEADLPFEEYCREVRETMEVIETRSPGAQAASASTT